MGRLTEQAALRLLLLLLLLCRLTEQAGLRLLTGGLAEETRLLRLLSLWLLSTAEQRPAKHVRTTRTGTRCGELRLLGAKHRSTTPEQGRSSSLLSVLLRLLLLLLIPE